jgi:hypothetical protein
MMALELDIPKGTKEKTGTVGIAWQLNHRTALVSNLSIKI